jgi:carboxypeptidase Taq
MSQFTATETLYRQYVHELQQIADIRYSVALLQWDQETYMPISGADFRSRQIATLSELAHTRFTAATFGRLLENLRSRNDLGEEQQVNIGLSSYDFGQQVKLPATFVRKISETTSKAYHAWIDARKANDFRIFSPSLEALVTLKKEEAELLGYEGHPYNALLNQFERSCTIAILDAAFSQLLPPLQRLLGKIGQCKQVDDHFLKQYYPEIDQWQFGMDLLQRMGFDLNAGRQDKSEHPFTINFNSRDVRITTRVDEQDMSNMTWSTIHELGHALYEQGLPSGQYGLPLGEYSSLGIHESQSRLWENNVGRSRAWTKNFLPVLHQYFPSQLGKISEDHFYKAINQVKPSLIRTEADELTYHFHIIIRYELEKALIGGTLSVKDIPEFWNAKYEQYLGVKVPDDRSGCLQDVHWSHGSFGYFPTYIMGSLYAAQFFAAASSAIPGLDQQLEKGLFSELLEWLRKNIHIHGRRYTSEELCRNITGEGINSSYFMQYVTNKYRFIYAFQMEEVAL